VLETAEQALLGAADRLRRALDAEPHAHADAEAEYASDMLAVCARNLVREIEASRRSIPERCLPTGWDDDLVDGTPDNPSWPGHRVFACGRCGEPFGTNCEAGTIACVECEARLCSGCGRWEGEVI